MTEHILDRPALHALRTCHARHARRSGSALGYDPEVAPFLVYEDERPETLSALGSFVPQGRIAIFLQAERPPALPGTAIEHDLDGVQMVAEDLPASVDIPGVTPLGEADAPEMVELAALTKPGPFLSRTFLLGGYVGIRDGGRLVAMAGERMRLPGHTEVSAVCTHPDHRGKGYGAALTLKVAHRIAARGETPFLHALAANAPAISLYEKLGFRLRRTMAVRILRRA